MKYGAGLSRKSSLLLKNTERQIMQLTSLRTQSRKHLTAYGLWLNIAKVLIILAMLTLASCQTLTGNGDSQGLTQSQRTEIRSSVAELSQHQFPLPSLKTLDKLKAMNDPDVNEWIQELATLCRKVDVQCRKESSNAN